MDKDPRGYGRVKFGVETVTPGGALEASTMKLHVRIGIPAEPAIRETNRVGRRTTTPSGVQDFERAASFRRTPEETASACRQPW